MIGAIGTTLAYAMCMGCPVPEEIQESFCHKLKGQEALEKGNKCYLDEQEKQNVSQLLKEALRWWEEDVKHLTTMSGEEEYNLFGEDPKWVHDAKKLLEI